MLAKRATNVNVMTCVFGVFLRKLCGMVAFCVVFLCYGVSAYAQINTDRVMSIGKNALYFEDYVLSIQYFNQVIAAKPYLAEPYFCRGVAKINLEDYVGAESDCSLALERNPFIAGAYHCRGIARINQEKVEEALKDFDEGLKYSPNFLPLMMCKAMTYAHTKNYGDAEKVLNDAVKAHPKSLAAIIGRARVRLNAENSDGALKDANTAVSIDKFNVDARATRAIVLLSKEKHDDALIDLNEAIRLSPNRADLYVNRALARHHKDDLNGAMEDYDFAITLDPDNTISRFNRALLRAEVGDLNRAIDDFTHVILLEPGNLMAIYNRALIEIQIGKADEAIADLNLVIAEYNDYPPLYQARAQAKKAKLDDRGAQIDMNTAFVLEQKAKRGKKEKKDDDAKTRNKSDKSIKKYNKMVTADPDEQEKRLTYQTDYRGKVQNVNSDIAPEPCFILTYYKTDSEVRTRAYSTNLHDFNQKYSLTNELLLANKMKTLAQTQINEHFASIDMWSDTLRRSINAKALVLRCLSYIHTGDLEKAQQDIDAFILLKPQEAMAYFIRGQVLTQKAETLKRAGEDNHASAELLYRMALGDFEKIIALAPDFAYAYFNAANMHLYVKEYDAALTEYGKAIEKDKSLGEAHYNMGLTLIYLGKTDEGVRSLSSAGEMGLYKAYNVIKRYKD